MPSPPWFVYERSAPKGFARSFDRAFGKGDDFEIAFLEPVSEAIPDCVEVLQILGNAYTRSGLYEKGLSIDRRLTAICPGDDVAHYNLACSLALLGRKDEAFESLARSLDLGYRDLHAMVKDKDLESLRTDPRFVQILRSMIRR